jgi:hypothetical protein
MKGGGEFLPQKASQDVREIHEAGFGRYVYTGDAQKLLP